MFSGRVVRVSVRPGVVRQRDDLLAHGVVAAVAVLDLPMAAVLGQPAVGAGARRAVSQSTAEGVGAVGLEVEHVVGAVDIDDDALGVGAAVAAVEGDCATAQVDVLEQRPQFGRRDQGGGLEAGTVPGAVVPRMRLSSAARAGRVGGLGEARPTGTARRPARSGGVRESTRHMVEADGGVQRPQASRHVPAAPLVPARRTHRHLPQRHSALSRRPPSPAYRACTDNSSSPQRLRVSEPSC